MKTDIYNYTLTAIFSILDKNNKVYPITFYF